MTDRPAPLRSDRVYAAVASLLVVLAAYYAFAGGPRDGAAPAVPALRILEPAANAELTQPVTIRFDAGAPLQAGAAGPGSGDRHLHVRVGGAELMAGSADIQPESGTVYRWVLPRLPAGRQTVQLFWSDAAHQPLRAGATPPLPVILR